MTSAIKWAWDWIASWFRTQSEPNMFMAGDPNEDDHVAYKEKVIRNSSNPYTVNFTMRKADQAITAIAVFPISDDLPSPEVEIINGGINWRNVTMRLTTTQSRWGCEIRICGS